MPLSLNRPNDYKTGTVGLPLSSNTLNVEGGENGEVVDRESPSDGLLLKKIAAGEMPPKNAGKARPLPAAEVEQVREWIAAGAPWPAGRGLDSV